MTDRETSRRGGQAERAQHPGGTRAQDALHSELARHRGGVQGPCAAERHQDEATRVDPSLDGHQAQGAQHLGLGDADDSLRAREHVEVELLRKARHDALGCRAVEREAARQGRDLEQVAEQQVGVGDRGPLTAPAVAGGSGKGARRGRPHA
jgi:hypothetical protein